MVNSVTSAFLFRGKSAEEVCGLLENDAPAFFEKGDTIYSPQSFTRAIGIILSGEADVLRAEGDRRILLNRLSAADSFGAAALYGGDGRYVTEVVAVSQCAVLFIGGARLSEMMRADFSLAENYISFLSGRIRFLNQRIADFTGGAAERRLAQYLRGHMDREGKVLVPKSMTALARALDMGRSSLYRALEALSGEGIIVHNSKEITVVDASKL